MQSQNKCPICGKSSELRCGRCKNVYYCSKQHQIEDWMKHKIQCQQTILQQDTKPHIQSGYQCTFWIRGSDPEVTDESKIYCLATRIVRMIQQRYHYNHSNKQKADLEFEIIQSQYNFDYYIDLKEIWHQLWQNNVKICLDSGLRYINGCFEQGKGWIATIVLKVSDYQHEQSIKNSLKKSIGIYLNRHGGFAGWLSHDQLQQIEDYSNLKRLRKSEIFIAWQNENNDSDEEEPQFYDQEVLSYNFYNNEEQYCF